MIRLEHLTKRFPGVARAVVDDISLEIPTGETCVLIGPSGCGKTTTMRMINRLIEPTSGRIRVGEEDVTHIDPVQLRRRIGYVIQQIGLFPHMTIAANIATVPRLLGWSEKRITNRVNELLALVGLEPDLYAARFPRQLSGGQRQRVGVARALAADPRVMLMDEPFGAIDPITRANLQLEFLKILRQLGKTVIFVTHDIEEAIRMGDRIAILQDGKVIQYGRPEDILSNPANPFVAEFVGADRALKRLDLTLAGDAATPGTGPDHLPTIDARESLKIALAQLLTTGADRLLVLGSDDQPQGIITLNDIRARAAGHQRMMS